MVHSHGQFTWQSIIWIMTRTAGLEVYLLLTPSTHLSHEQESCGNSHAKGFDRASASLSFSICLTRQCGSTMQVRHIRYAMKGHLRAVPVSPTAQYRGRFYSPYVLKQASNIMLPALY